MVFRDPHVFSKDQSSMVFISTAPSERQIISNCVGNVTRMKSDVRACAVSSQVSVPDEVSHTPIIQRAFRRLSITDFLSFFYPTEAWLSMHIKGVAPGTQEKGSSKISLQL